jgi:hypothetical protein
MSACLEADSSHGMPTRKGKILLRGRLDQLKDCEINLKVQGKLTFCWGRNNIVFGRYWKGTWNE